MLPVSKTSLALLLALVASAWCQGGTSMANRPDKPIQASALLPHQFEELWSSYVPDVSITGAWLLGDAIYMYTADDQLISLDAREGVVRWLVNLPRKPEFPPTLYNYPKERSSAKAVYYDEVYVVGKDLLMVIDEEIGTVKWTRELNFAASSPAWGAFSTVMLGSWNDRVYAIDKKKESIGWFYRTDGDIVIPGSSTESKTFVPSDDGKLYIFDPGNGTLTFSVRTLGPITCTPLFYRHKVYVGSRDYNVYCIDERGQLSWRFPCGAPVRGQLVVFPSRVGWHGDPEIDKLYALNDKNELFAVYTENDRDGDAYRSGEAAWVATRIKQVLARGYNDVYMIDLDGRLVSVEDATGKVQFTDDSLISGADFIFTNTRLPDRRARRGVDTGGTIFLGYRNGWFVGIKEKPRF